MASNSYHNDYSSRRSSFNGIGGGSRSGDSGRRHSHGGVGGRDNRYNNYNYNYNYNNGQQPIRQHDGNLYHHPQQQRQFTHHPHDSINFTPPPHQPPNGIANDLSPPPHQPHHGIADDLSPPPQMSPRYRHHPQYQQSLQDYAECQPIFDINRPPQYRPTGTNTTSQGAITPTTNGGSSIAGTTMVGHHNTISIQLPSSQSSNCRDSITNSNNRRDSITNSNNNSSRDRITNSNSNNSSDSITNSNNTVSGTLINLHRGTIHLQLPSAQSSVQEKRSFQDISCDDDNNKADTSGRDTKRARRKSAVNVKHLAEFLWTEDNQVEQDLFDKIEARHKSEIEYLKAAHKETTDAMKKTIAVLEAHLKDTQAQLKDKQKIIEILEAKKK